MLFYLKHFKPLFIAFGGVKARNSHYVVVEIVNVLSLNQMRELVNLPEGWLSKALALSVDQLTISVDQIVASVIPTKS